MDETVRPAEFHIVLAVGPHDVVLPLVTTPGIHPWPPTWVVTDIVGRSNGHPWQLVVDICVEEVRHVVSGRLLVESDVIDGEAIAVEVECGLIQQGRADGIGGVHNTLPRGNGHRRTDCRIGAAGP